MINTDVKIICACSNGGHLTEMLSIINCLNLKIPPTFITYKENAEGILTNAYFLKNMGKIINVPIGLLKIFQILLKEKPDIVISTGAEIGLFSAMIAKIFFRSKIIYVECSAQVNIPSISGRIIYYFSDLFFVQWRPLLRYYGRKSRYAGNLIFGNL